VSLEGAMRRREFVTFVARAAALWPGIALGQQPAKVWRVAYLSPASLATPTDRAMFDVFRAEMRAMGYIKGKNLLVDDRGADGRAEHLPSLVSELIALRPDAFVAVATPAIAAAQRRAHSAIEAWAGNLKKRTR
jgi:putative ABC transport system substrate-binding protein